MAYTANLKKVDKEKLEEFKAAWKAVDSDDPSRKDIAKFREILSIQSDTWRVFADLVELARQEIFEQINMPQGSMKLALEQGYLQVRDELGFEDSSMLEKILIEQIALTWLRHNWIEFQYQNVAGKNPTLNQGQYWERKLSMSQRRLLRAIESLAKIRKLASRTPEILQVNIAKQQQVNQVTR